MSTILEKRTVGEVMRTDVITARPEQTVAWLARVLSENRITGAPVLDDAGVVIGVATASDVLELAGEPGEGKPGRPDRMETTAVREIMMPATFSVRPASTLEEAARFLLQADIHRALVFDEGRLVGVITATDMLRELLES